MNRIKNTNKFMIFAVVLIIIYLIFVAAIFNSLFLKKNTNSTNSPLPTPTKAQIQSQQEGNIHNNTIAIPTEFAKPLEAARSISDLLEKLPHTGKYFSLSYEYGTDTFNLVLDGKNQALAEEELKLFLNQNKITGKDSLQNIYTTFK